MEKQLDKLSDRIDELIEMNLRLRDENLLLQDEVEQLQQDKHALHDKNIEARGRLDSIIEKLRKGND